MSAEDEKLVLDEYATWTVTRSEHVDLSVDAFMAEREAEHNKRRIEDALGILDNYLEMEGNVGRLQNAIRTACDALVDDRPYMLNNSFTGKTERVFT